MDLSIAAFLTQDGVTNGAIYALLALALVLVFAVTRIIWIPSGEFVAYGTLTLAGLQLGKAPGIVGLLVAVAVAAALVETFSTIRAREWRRLPRRLALWLGLPLLVAAAVWWAAPRAFPLPVQVMLTLAAVTALGPLLYRLPTRAFSCCSSYRSRCTSR
jgi:branched-chain amino acid transport system permease protein